MRSGVSTLRDYLQVVQRRKGVIAQAAGLVPLVAVLFSVRPPAVYPAAADCATRALHEAAVRTISVRKFLDSSSVSAKQNADLLTFTVDNHDPKLAARRANAYAAAYKEYRNEVETAPIRAAIEKVRARISG